MLKCLCASAELMRVVLDFFYRPENAHSVPPMLTLTPIPDGAAAAAQLAVSGHCCCLGSIGGRLAHHLCFTSVECIELVWMPVLQL